MDKASEPGANAPKADVSAKKQPTIGETVRKHVDAHAKSVSEDPAKHALSGPPLFSEHADEFGLEPWQRKALLARFHAHGLRHETRIPKDVFEAALNEATKERV